MGNSPDLDLTRAAVAERQLIPTAIGYLTAEVAASLPFEALADFKNHLKRFFSSGSWERSDEASLSDLVAPHVSDGWWEHDLGAGIWLSHGIRDGEYILLVGGASGAGTPSIFDRAFDGPVVPEPTPHPRKVKFAFGGDPEPGVWYRRGDADAPKTPGAARLLNEPDVTDVMEAGDFVTIGLSGRSSWEHRLEPLLALVTELYATGSTGPGASTMTREEMIQEAGRSRPRSHTDELHLLDPDDHAHRKRLVAALEAADPRVRRTAFAILIEADDPELRRSILEKGLDDDSRTVRRTALDAAGDAEDERLRDIFEAGLRDPDAWIRWRSARAIGSIGADASRENLEAAAGDEEFRVRFEAERVLREFAP